MVQLATLCCQKVATGVEMLVLVPPLLGLMAAMVAMMSHQKEAV
jgi:hypothetical protein